MRYLTGLALAMLLCANAWADEINLSFNSDAVRAFYVHDFARRDLQGELGFANNSDKGYVVNASLFVSGFASDGVNPLQAGLGARAAYVDGDFSGQSGFPLAVGGFVQYTLPAYNRLSVRADAWYAPDILSLGKLDKYEDYTVRVQYNLLKQADVYVGARYLKAEFDNGSQATFDNGLHAGLRFRF